MREANPQQRYSASLFSPLQPLSARKITSARNMKIYISENYEITHRAESKSRTEPEL